MFWISNEFLAWRVFIASLRANMTLFSMLNFSQRSHTMIYLINYSRSSLFFAEGFCGRIPRKDFQCRMSICGRIPRKDFAEGCGRIQKNKLLFCWPIFAEGSLRKDSAEGFSMRNKHYGRIPRKDFAEGFRKDPRKDPRGRIKNRL